MSMLYLFISWFFRLFSRFGLNTLHPYILLYNRNSLEYRESPFLNSDSTYSPLQLQDNAEQATFKQTAEVFSQDMTLGVTSMQAVFIKSIFDKLFAFVAVIMLLPVYVFIAILIKLDSKGPILFMPIRVGRNGEKFIMFKFRTMDCNDDATLGSKSTVENDPRITDVGKILRKYSLDELPQFFNVLVGNMSVVGPRPHRIVLDERIQSVVEGYDLRKLVKPGVTGWAQVNGWRGPTKTHEQIYQRTSFDLDYIRNWSLSLDIKIIYQTVFSEKVRNNAF